MKSVTVDEARRIINAGGRVNWQGLEYSLYKHPTMGLMVSSNRRPGVGEAFDAEYHGSALTSPDTRLIDCSREPLRQAYQEGRNAWRRHGVDKYQKCPYGLTQGALRSQWLAGWHDKANERGDVK